MNLQEMAMKAQDEAAQNELVELAMDPVVMLANIVADRAILLIAGNIFARGTSTKAEACREAFDLFDQFQDSMNEWSGRRVAAAQARVDNVHPNDVDPEG